MATNSGSSVPTWRVISPENFELTLRRLLEPTAEDKLKVALDRVMADIEASKSGPAAERREKLREELALRKKKERLERRLKKLQELKEKAAGPLIGALFLAGLIWILALVLGGWGAVTGVSAIQRALAEDMKNIEENQANGLTVKELDKDFAVGQLMGVPGGERNEEGLFPKTSDDEYLPPEYLLEVTGWTPELDSCERTIAELETSETLAGCEATGKLELRVQDAPELTATCIFFQLGSEAGLGKNASEDNQRAFARATRLKSEAPATQKPRFYVAGGTKSWDETMLLWCQTLGAEKETFTQEVSYIVGQVAVRMDAQLYLAGGIVTWLEADGSYAPERVWEGHRPAD